MARPKFGVLVDLLISVEKGSGYSLSNEKIKGLSVEKIEWLLLI